MYVLSLYVPSYEASIFPELQPDLAGFIFRSRNRETSSSVWGLWKKMLKIKSSLDVVSLCILARLAPSVCACEYELRLFHVVFNSADSVS